MSHLQYHAYDGVGARNAKVHGYREAVRVGDRIECSGQGMCAAMSLTENPSSWVVAYLLLSYISPYMRVASAPDLQRTLRE